MCGRKAEDPVQLLVPANQLGGRPFDVLMALIEARNCPRQGLTGRPSARSSRQSGSTRKRPNATLAGVPHVRSISR
jgi:hypothetical protein